MCTRKRMVGKKCKENDSHIVMNWDVVTQMVPMNWDFVTRNMMIKSNEIYF